MNARASIIVLTHDRPVLLHHSVASALNQTVSDVEVLILGDGVTEATRASATALTADPRVRFLDYPKGPHRGEIHRDTAIREATSNAIFYLCDDDLLLPTHVENLLDLLQSHNFVQSKNCWVDDAGRVIPHVADLASPGTIWWHLRDDLRYNAVSITGTAHLRDFYLQAEQPWSTTPPGQWPDHYQWRKLFAQPQFDGATSVRATALQFPATVGHREHWTELEQVAELEPWITLLATPDAESRLDQMYQTGIRYALEQTGFVQLHNQLEVKHMRASRSWRFTAPLRALYALRQRITTRAGSGFRGSHP